MRTTAPAVCAWLAACSAALGVGNKTMVYDIHEEPENSSSPVTFTVKLYLSPQAVIPNRDDPGGTVKWRVLKIGMIQVGSPSLTWEETDPEVDTSDELWHIVHEDLDHLQNSEFTQPPLVAGWGAPVGHSGDDLEYSFQGQPPGGSPVYPTTGWADYYFKEETAEESIEEADDQPVDVGND